MEAEEGREVREPAGLKAYLVGTGASSGWLSRAMRGVMLRERVGPREGVGLGVSERGLEDEWGEGEARDAGGTVVEGRRALVDPDVAGDRVLAATDGDAPAPAVMPADGAV